MPTVDAYRAGSRVDFSRAGYCVAPSRSSLPPSKRYLSRSSPLCMYFRCDKDSSRFGICQYIVDFQDPGLVFSSGYVSNHYLYGVGVDVADGEAVVDGLGLAVGLAVEVAVGLADGDGVSEKLVADIIQTWALLNSACAGIL
jgi:hypothetical protein